MGTKKHWYKCTGQFTRSGSGAESKGRKDGGYEHSSEVHAFTVH